MAPGVGLISFSCLLRAKMSHLPHEIGICTQSWLLITFPVSIKEGSDSFNLSLGEHCVLSLSPALANKSAATTQVALEIFSLAFQQQYNN